jgi:hypothetical protein
MLFLIENKSKQIIIIITIILMINRVAIEVPVPSLIDQKRNIYLNKIC